LRIGSGSRLKILEAMAMKKPVISTAIGAEGLRIDDGKNIILANRPDVFAAELLQLLDRPDQQRALGDKGFELVKSSYDWRMLAEKQNAIWEAMEKEN
jgi:glycosyltransferase involved in cell wall biosynthesis